MLKYPVMSEKDFKCQYYDYLNENLEVLKQFEKYRKKLLFKTIFFSFLFFLFALVIVWVISFLILKNIYNPVLFPLLLFFLYVFLLKSMSTIILTDRQYQQKFNEEILPLISAPIANFKNWPKNQNTAAIIDSKLFPNFDTQEDLSCLFGYYKGNSITISDTRLTLPVRASEKPDIFKGIIIQADVEKNIKNHVILISKNENKNNKYKSFKTGISELDENLYTFVKNDSNMEFICSRFWEILKRFASAYCAKSLSFSYHNNTVIAAMKQRKAMPFGYLFKSLINMKNYDEFIEKFIVIYELVDFLSCY